MALLGKGASTGRRVPPAGGRGASEEGVGAGGAVSDDVREQVAGVTRGLRVEPAVRRSRGVGGPWLRLGVRGPSGTECGRRPRRVERGTLG